MVQVNQGNSSPSAFNSQMESISRPAPENPTWSQNVLSSSCSMSSAELLQAHKS